VQRNFTCPRGEIDIVAEDRGTLVFVEVKARDVHGNELPEAAVTRSKRRRLCLAAREFIRRYRLGGRTFRFDVVGVDLEGDEPVRVHHWPNVVEYRNAVRRRRS